jgi:hypothetical protein
MKTRKSIKRLTLYIIFGSYGGFHISKTGIGLGWITLRILPIDIENVMEILRDENKKLKEMI